MPNIRVLIVDDHPVVLQGIRGFLEGADGIDIAGTASGGMEALRLLKELSPDVLVLDIEMADISGVEVVKLLREWKLPVNILALSSYDDREYIREMLRLGSAGYLIKDEAAELIVEAVRGVARGEKGWMSRSVSAMVFDILDNEKKDDQQLTPREAQVLDLIVDGSTNSRIAFLLNVSEKTVEKHIAEIFSKLKVKSRLDAAVIAVRKEQTRGRAGVD